MQWFILARQRLSVFPSHFTLLHRSLTTNDYLRSGLVLHSCKIETCRLHFCQLPSRTTYLSAYFHEVLSTIRRNLYPDGHPAGSLLYHLPSSPEACKQFQLNNHQRLRTLDVFYSSLLIVRRRFKFRINFHHSINQLMSFFLQTFPRPKLPSIHTFSIEAINRFWRRRSTKGITTNMTIHRNPRTKTYPYDNPRCHLNLLLHTLRKFSPRFHVNSNGLISLVIFFLHNSGTGNLAKSNRLRLSPIL